MIVQNSPAPWAILALVMMVGCVGVGMLLGNVGPFNSETAAARMQITQTQAAFNAYTTQSAIQSSQTQQAPIAQQTLVVAEMTAIPLQQTATSIAEFNSFQAAQVKATQTALEANSQNSQMMVHATQTAISDNRYIQSLSNNATVTAIAQRQINTQNASTRTYIFSVILALALCGWIIVYGITKVVSARTQEKLAHAQLLAEQRRLVSLRTSIQVQRKIPSQPNRLPTSLMKNPSNGKGLPRGE